MNAVELDGFRHRNGNSTEARIRAILTRRALAEQTKATWLNRFLAPASLLGGNRDAGRQSLRALSCSFPN